jgi:hypothetical protein
LVGDMVGLPREGGKEFGGARGGALLVCCELSGWVVVAVCGCEHWLLMAGDGDARSRGEQASKWGGERDLGESGGGWVGRCAPLQLQRACACACAWRLDRPAGRPAMCACGERRDRGW